MVLVLDVAGLREGEVRLWLHGVLLGEWRRVVLVELDAKPGEIGLVAPPASRR